MSRHRHPSRIPLCCLTYTTQILVRPPKKRFGTVLSGHEGSRFCRVPEPVWIRSGGSEVSRQTAPAKGVSSRWVILLRSPAWCPEDEFVGDVVGGVCSEEQADLCGLVGERLWGAGVCLP